MHEGDGQSSVLIRLDSVSEVPLEINYTLGGNATGTGVDFTEETAIPGKVLIPAGTLISEISFDILGDVLQDGNKIIDIAINSVTADSMVGVVDGIASHQLTIIDTDGPLTITIVEKVPDTLYYDPLPPIFEVIFNRIIDTLFHDLLSSDFDYSDGTATGIIGSVTNGTGADKDKKYELKIDSISGDGTVIPKLPAGILRAFEIGPPSATNAETVGDTAIFDVDVPQNPVSWNLSSPADGATSADVTPQVSGTGIANEEGSVAHIYLTPTCSDSIGSGVISAGSFTVSNVSLPGAGSNDGLKEFYGAVIDVASRTSNCIDLNLGYTLNTSVGGIPDVVISASSGQADPANSLPISYDVVFSEIIDPATFDTTDIDQTGTATVVTWVLATSDNTTWTLTATNVSSSGTVIPSIAINKVQNFSGTNNTLSTTTGSGATDSDITYNMPATPGVPANFYATTLDGEIELNWDSCTNCIYDLYWDTSTGVSLASTAVLGLTSATYTHTGLTNGTLHYYRVRATVNGAPSSALTAEINAMPYSDICDFGDLKSSCTISGSVVIPDNAKISANGNITIASGGHLQSNTGQSIALDVSGALVVESGGLITANFTSLVTGGLDIQSGSTFTGDVTSLSTSTFVVGGTMNTNITDSNITNLTISSGGVLSSDSRGYLKETGDAPGGPASTGGGGAGHGGSGGVSAGGSSGGATYGAVAGPITLGSGGGGGGGGGLPSPNGSFGGGKVKLVVKETFTNDGTISVQGATGYQGGGGGAGGSIWIDVGNLITGGAGSIDGGGSISAAGAKGNYFGGWAGGGGGGGRIAIHVKDYKYRGSIDVAGGSAAGGNSTAGSRGTFDLQVTNVSSLCDTGTMIGNDCQISTEIYLGDAYMLAGTNYTIASPGALIGNFTIDLTGDLTINSGAKISADRFGHGRGPSYPGAYSGGGGGAGHGGAGGRSTGAINGGAVDGVVVNPITFGSGGSGVGNFSYNGTIPAGGGAIKILVAGTLTNDGIISSNGGYGTGGGGGGAGGSLWIDVGITNLGGAGIFQGSGSIAALGGRSYPYGSLSGGGGGGGRIALHSSNFKYRGVVDISGGDNSGGNSVAGERGSYYLLVSDINSLCDTGTMNVGDCLLSSNLYLSDGFLITGNSFAIGGTGALFGNITMDLTGDLTISAGGQISADGIGVDAGSGVAGNFSNGGGGGGHGGLGGRSSGAINGGGSFGDQANPITHGAQGGATGGAGPASIAAVGGGAIKIFVQETFTNDGTISAIGGNAVGGGGGGAGGSIWIDVGITNSGGVGILQGTGSFSVAGGRGQDYGTWHGGGGGGGLIAIHSSNYKYRGTVNVKGGIAAGGNANSGGPGYFYQVVTFIDSLCDTGSMGGFDCELTNSIYLGENFSLTGSDYTIRTGGAIYGNTTIDLSGDLTLDAGAIISANGFGDAVGLGYIANASSGGGGGGHGGAGGRSSGAENGGGTYGDDAFPVTKGSGGASTGTLGSSVNTVNGGGLIKILVTGTLTNNGSITSNGANGTGGSGSAAGGSIWIDVGIINTGGAGILTGTGEFSAIGGNGSSYSSWRGGGGGGGRLALHSVEYLYRGSLDVAGGTTVSGGYSRKGSTGTFYQQVTDLDSLCDGATSFATTCLISTSLTLGDGLDISGGAINNFTIDNSGSITSIAATSKINMVLLGDLIINPSGSMSLDIQNLAAVNMNVYGSFTGSILDSSFTNLTVFTGGSISADGRGHSGGSSKIAGFGIGGGSFESSGTGGGGGYAALGGDASGAATTGGAVYGATRLPIHMGSGGGAGYANSQGGHGGGILLLEASGTITIDGTISANGLVGTLGAGGGSGGSIWLEANTLTGIAGGNIFATGGDGGVSGARYGGGGSGGRTGFFVATDTFTGTGTIAVTAGLKGGGAATDGTIGVSYNSATSSDHMIVTTSQTYTGNISGLTGGDDACNDLMVKQGLGGSWKAVLSTDTVDASTHLSFTKAVSNLRADSAGGPQEVAANGAGFWSGTLSATVNYDETGVTIANSIWTGTDGTPTAGLNSGSNCTNWTSDGGNGSIGATNTTTSTWLNSTLSSCANSQSIYCVSQ